MLADFQRKFAAGLLKRDAAQGETPVDVRGFGIHARNSLLSLRMALGDVFPVTKRLVGADFFGAMADVFVAEHPPKHGWLSAYGDGFPDFVAGYQPAAELSYLPDVARVEWARVHAANAPDDPGLDLKALAGMEPETLERLHLRLHGAATLVCASYPIFDIWQSHLHADDEKLGSIDLDKGPQNVLISRPAALEVGVALLSCGDAALLTTLAGNSSFASAYQAAVLVETDYDLGTRLGNLVGLRAFAALTL
jgi:hypothetical protein